MVVDEQRSKVTFLDGGGRMGALMRSHDWTKSPLGHPASWPDALKLAVATCLSSRFPMVIWWGPQLLMLYNDAWQPILGETKHPAGLGRPGAESWPETWPIVGRQFEDALQGQASWSEDLLLASDRHGFMEECYFTYSHSPLKDAAGAVVGVHSVVSETTAHVLNERRLRVLRDLSNAAVDATNETKSLTDTGRTLLARLCGGNPDVPFAVQYQADGSGCARPIASAGVDAALFPIEVRPDDDDGWGIAAVLRGQPHVVVDRSSSAAGPLPGGAWPEPTTQVVALPVAPTVRGSDPAGVLLVGVNSRLRLDQPYMDFLTLATAQLASALSALQLLDRERAARTDAERAARLRDEFLATLSHELRTPLSAVIGWAQILKTNLADASQIATAVEVIERNAQLQSRLITDLLDISRAISGNLQLDRQPVNLSAVTAAAIQSVTPAAAAKALRVQTVLEPLAEPLIGDPARIQQILWNLLVNAIEFTPRGGLVRIELTTVNRHAEIRVSDTGEGIDPEFLPHVFERFRQADASRTRRHGGLGLGLAIVKQFAELHGGRVRATSAGTGHGATFIVELPLGGSAADELTGSRVHTPAEPYVDETRRSLNRARVLVVDDQPDALLMIRRMLEDHDARVLTASTAQAALDFLASDTFDVIISDIGMPGLDGYDFIAEVRKRGIDTPAVAWTALARREDRSKAFAAGYQAHLSKPVDSHVLLAALSQLTKRKGT